MLSKGLHPKGWFMPFSVWMVFTVLLGREALDPRSSKTLHDPFMCENRAGSPLLGSVLVCQAPHRHHLPRELNDDSPEEGRAGVTSSL